jgi:hypothetical protein
MGNRGWAVLWLGLVSLRGAATASPDSEAPAPKESPRCLEVALKGLCVGMGQPGARYLGAAEARWRLLGGKRYAMGAGGTLLFPTPEGALRPGAFASVGLGVDDAR